MTTDNPLLPFGDVSAQLVPDILVKNGGSILFLLALLLFAFSLFVFRYHLSRFSVHKIRALTAELIYIIGSVLLFMGMAATLISL